jgi:hypothetical protein
MELYSSAIFIGQKLLEAYIVTAISVDCVVL